MISKIIITITISLFLSGCDMANGDVKQIVANIKKSNMSKMDELPKLQEYEQSDYNASKLNDPFDIPANQIVAKNPGVTRIIKEPQKRPDYDRPREYLEGYSLDTLTMVGTLQKRGEMWALIVDRNGIIHRVKEGNYLGQNSGKITKITEDQVALDETVSDGQGGWTTRDANLNIKH